jgi:hypothetical protein
VINVANTNYKVILAAAKTLGYDVTEDEDAEFDIVWYDNGI